MEQENKKQIGIIIQGSIFAAISCLLCSCSILSSYSNYAGKEGPLVLTETYRTIPNDSMVSLPQMTIKDTILYEIFEDIMYLDSTYLSPLKFGEKSWYEAIIKEYCDTIFIELRSHQYEYYERPRNNLFDGVIFYKENYFLIRKGSSFCDLITNQLCDTLEFNSISNNSTVYYIFDKDYNFPEYAIIKYCYYKGCLRVQNIEVNKIVLNSECVR